ncbi:MAG TPA: TonB-dependent receptor, partial [Ignavibacteriales bacterium]|nr:TonB-dependent receptor [Ignavibacteriales bacterium]
DFWTLGNHIVVHNVKNGDVIKDVPSDSVGGSWNYGLNEAGDARMYAFYAGDSWQVTNQIRLDLGARYQFFNLNFTLDHGAWPDGKIDRIANLDGNDWAGTGAINYAINNNVGVFVRGSKGSLFPNFDQIRENVGYKLKEEEAGSNPQSIKGTLDANLFNQFELGVKIDQELYSLFITGFLNTVEVFDGDVGAARAAALLKTRTFGAEIDAALSVEGFKANLIGTFQSGEITESSDPTAVGKKVWRQPDLQFRFAPSYEFQLSENINATLYGAIRYVGTRWNDRDNSYELDAYSKLDVGIDVSTSSGLTFNLSGDNLADSDGLTEGDPRDPLSKNGRPILGRSIKFSVGVSF